MKDMDKLEIYKILLEHNQYLKTDGKEGKLADFSHMRLNKFDFSYLDLSQANFSFSNLAGCDFSASNLRQTNFSHANLWRVNFFLADLSQADLSNVGDSFKVNYSHADLRDADLYNNIFTGCIVSFTILDKDGKL